MHLSNNPLTKLSSLILPTYGKVLFRNWCAPTAADPKRKDRYSRGWHRICFIQGTRLLEWAASRRSPGRLRIGDKRTRRRKQTGRPIVKEQGALMVSSLKPVDVVFV